MGTTTTVGGRTVNVGNQNPALNTNIVNIGTIGLNTGSNTVNIGLTNTNTVINGGGVTIGANTVGGYFYPSQMRVTSGAENIELYFRGASNTVNNTYETQIKSYNGAPWNAEGQGLQQMFSGQQEFIYNGSFTPRNLYTDTGLGFGYYDGGGTVENSATISGYAPYGAVRFGGCGLSNTKGFSTTWGQSMAIYPGYGTRLFNGGLSFDKGSLSPSSGAERGWVPQCGVYPLTTTTIGANSNTTVAMSFGYTFSANPYITVTMISNLAGGNVDGLIPTVYSLSTTGFSVVIKNTQGSTSGNQWGFHYIAWGPY